MEIIFVIIGLILCSISIFLFIKRESYIKKTNHNVEKQNATLEQKNKQLRQENNELQKEQLEVKYRIQKEVASQVQLFDEIKEQQAKQSTAQLKAIKDATANYVEMLESRYEQCEKEFDEKIQVLDDNKAKAEQELEDLKNARAAVIEAYEREKTIKQDPDQYCIKLAPADRNDIQTLERIKDNLNNPRILSMLIWQTFFQKQFTALCNSLLGTSTICGIYKITNLESGECYIGQSVNISERWKSHFKCGVGIDTPPQNKLYKAMQDYGMWNFSWELLEKCSKENLDEREKYYIELYNSYSYGYNSTRGNNK